MLLLFVLEHCRGSLTLLGRATVCLALGCLLGMSSPTWGQEVDLEVVTEALDAYESAFKSLCLSGKYREHFDISVENPENYSRTNNQYVVEFDHDLANGRWRYDERHSWLYAKFSQEPFELRVIYTFDGENPSRLWHTLTRDPTGTGFPPERPMDLTIFKSLEEIPRKLTSVCLPGQIFHHHNKAAQSLLGYIYGEYCIWEGADQVSGVDCYKLLIRPPPDVQRGWVQHTVWVDPAHGYLPMRQETRKFLARKLQETIISFVEITKFQEYRLPNSTKVWIPTHARMETQTDHNGTWELLDLKFQESLPVERFRIDQENLPPGVLVNDRNTISFIGGDEGQTLYEEWYRLSDVHHDSLARKLGSNMPTPPTTPKAPVKPQPRREPETSLEDVTSSSTWLITNAILLTLVAGGWAYQRLHKKSARKRT